MDALTALLIAVLMMLLNGGVLGLMHSDLPAALRPSAISWRIGTLLQAGGCVLLAVQRELLLAFVLPLANAMLILGITGYWRALRQFYGHADSPWLLLPTVVGTFGVYWYAAITPDLAASTDYLSGLANRRTLAMAGELRLQAVKSGVSGATLAVAVIDIDHFKAINDRHGHDIGDEALKHVAALVDRACRGRGQCGRQGGEEFVVLLDDVDPQAAFAAAEQLRRSVQDEPFHFDGGELSITVSVGVALARQSDRRLDDVLRRADQALYRAKAGGRNRVDVAP